MKNTIFIVIALIGFFINGTQTEAQTIPIVGKDTYTFPYYPIILFYSFPDNILKSDSARR